MLHFLSISAFRHANAGNFFIYCKQPQIHWGPIFLCFCFLFCFLSKQTNEEEAKTVPIWESQTSWMSLSSPWWMEGLISAQWSHQCYVCVCVSLMCTTGSDQRFGCSLAAGLLQHRHSAGGKEEEKKNITGARRRESTTSSLHAF